MDKGLSNYFIKLLLCISLIQIGESSPYGPFNGGYHMPPAAGWGYDDYEMGGNMVAQPPPQFYWGPPQPAPQYGWPPQFPTHMPSEPFGSEQWDDSSHYDGYPEWHDPEPDYTSQPSGFDDELDQILVDALEKEATRPTTRLGRGKNPNSVAKKPSGERKKQPVIKKLGDSGLKKPSTTGRKQNIGKPKPEKGRTSGKQKQRSKPAPKRRPQKKSAEEKRTSAADAGLTPTQKASPEEEDPDILADEVSAKLQAATSNLDKLNQELGSKPLHEKGRQRITGNLKPQSPKPSRALVESELEENEPQTGDEEQKTAIYYGTSNPTLKKYEPIEISHFGGPKEVQKYEPREIRFHGSGRPLGKKYEPIQISHFGGKT